MERIKPSCPLKRWCAIKAGAKRHDHQIQTRTKRMFSLLNFPLTRVSIASERPIVRDSTGGII
jgi:hypothetical protein